MRDACHATLRVITNQALSPICYAPPLLYKFIFFIQSMFVRSEWSVGLDGVPLTPLSWFFTGDLFELRVFLARHITSAKLMPSIDYINTSGLPARLRRALSKMTEI